MSLFNIMFYFFAVLTVLSAFVVVNTRNVVYAAFNLMLTLFGVAGLYVLLSADFIAIVQLIVYVGGILILIIFGVMLTNKITDVDIKTGLIHQLPASILLGALTGLLLMIVISAKWRVVEQVLTPASALGDMGKLLLNEYSLIFELLGALLLIALIGAASIARK